jgi:methylaspartate ammonia-lyase
MLLAVNLRSRSDKSVVMVKKIGIVPNGLIRGKKEVRHKGQKLLNHPLQQYYL